MTVLSFLEMIRQTPVIIILGDDKDAPIDRAKELFVLVPRQVGEFSAEFVAFIPVVCKRRFCP